MLGIVKRLLETAVFDRPPTSFFAGLLMETTRSDSKTMIKSGAFGTRRVVLCAAVFLTTLLFVSGLGSPGDDGAKDGHSATGPVTARVLQRFAADGPPGLSRPNEDDLKRRIVGPPSLRRLLMAKNGPDVSEEMIRQLGENLQVSIDAGPAAETMEVSITSTDSDPLRAARVVNALARQYVGDANEKFAALAGQPGRDAREDVEAAGRELFEAQAQFHRFLERHFREHGHQADGGRTWPTRLVVYSPESLTLESEPPPGMIENSDWTVAARRISKLAEQRESLLVDRTPRHPEVRGIETRISDCRIALEQIPRYVQGRVKNTDGQPSNSDEQPSNSDQLPRVLPSAPVKHPVENPRPQPGQSSREHEVAVREFQMYKVAVDNATEAYERLSLEERQAWRRQYSPPGIELQLAKVEENSRLKDPSRGTMSVALLVALGMAAGVGMIFSGLGKDPTLDTVEQVRAGLPIPVVGTIAAANPAAAEANRRRSNQSSSRALTGYGVGLVLVSLLILLTAFG
jgi:capsular polysaccharide biosynthesis protein